MVNAHINAYGTYGTERNRAYMHTNFNNESQLYINHDLWRDKTGFSLTRKGVEEMIRYMEEWLEETKPSKYTVKKMGYDFEVIRDEVRYVAGFSIATLGKKEACSRANKLCEELNQKTGCL